MSLDDLKPSGDDSSGRDRARDRWLAVFIGILAVLLAICSMGGDNAAKEATLKNIEATNTWAFFQAKNLRRQIVRSQIENFELAIISTPAIDPQSKASLEKTIATYKGYEARLTSDPKSGEGLDELFVKAKDIEALRDEALKQDPYFDYGQALLQIAIVVASVAIISGGGALVVLSAVLGAIGTFFMVNGFTLAIDVPFFG